MFLNKDSRLWRKAKRGDERSFLELYRRYRDSVYGLSLALTGSREAAEDICQDLFSSLLSTLDTIDIRNFRAYVLKSARNLSMRWLDKEETQRRKISGMAIPNFHLSAFTELDSGESSENVLGLLERLPMEQREVVVMHVFQDMSFGQMAELTGLSRNTLKTRYRYAMEKLGQMNIAR